MNQMVNEPVQLEELTRTGRETLLSEMLVKNK